MSVGKKKVSAIIVLYNPDYKHLNLFCSHLKEQVDEIILVDNTPNCFVLSSDFKTSKFENVLYVPNGANLGIAEAQNIGIKKSIEIEADFSILFDQDSDVENDFISRMVDSYRLLSSVYNNIGSIGPAFIDMKTNEYADIIKTVGFKVCRVKPSIDRDYTECDYMI
ncbi:MAG: glycosyltransferase, partial [Acinetobacter baumannii]|nr:glycosyltransferase [Acinetobacter baumannii]